MTYPTVRYNTGQAGVTVVHKTVVSYTIELPIIATAILLPRDDWILYTQIYAVECMNVICNITY